MYTYIHICIERERERYVYEYIYIYTYIYIYIYICCSGHSGSSESCSDRRGDLDSAASASGTAQTNHLK